MTLDFELDTIRCSICEDVCLFTESRVELCLFVSLSIVRSSKYNCFFSFRLGL